MDSNNSTDTPLFQYFSEFEEYYLKIGRSKITIRNVRSSLRFFENYLGIKTIEDANTPRLVKDAMLRCKDEVIDGRTRGEVSCNSYLKDLSIYMRWLASMEYIPENKVKKIYRFRESSKRQPTLSEEQVEKLIKQTIVREKNTLRRYRNELCIRLFVLTGMRPEEFTRLKCSDVCLTNEGVKVDLNGAKGGGIRPYLFKKPELKHSLEAYMSIRKRLNRNEDVLFVSSTHNGLWTKSGLRKFFTNISRELGFKATAYPIRRYVATKLHNEGLDIFDIQKHLGHKKISTTLRYFERSPKFTEKSSAVMEKDLLGVKKVITKNQLIRRIKFQKMLNLRHMMSSNTLPNLA